MNIGLIVAGYPPDRIGGAELQARQLAEQLVASGHNVTVFTRRLVAGREMTETADGIQIRRRRVIPIPGLRLIWDTCVTAIQVVRQRPRPDVLLCYLTVNSGLTGIVVNFFIGIPAVISIRGNEEYRVASSRLKRLVTKIAYRRASLIAVQTSRIRSELLELFAQSFDENYLAMLRLKLHVVSNGINLPEPTAVQGGNVLYVGRLIENKGVDDLLAAMAGVKHLQTVIVGDGPDRGRLEELAHGLKVSFEGLVGFEDVPRYLKEARMLVLPSRLGDGLPNVIIEAMACGVPVIATRSAGIPDIICHGKTGYLFDPGDRDTLLKLIQSLANDDELHAEIRENALDYVGQYAWSAVIPKVESMLETARSLR